MSSCRNFSEITESLGVLRLRREVKRGGERREDEHGIEASFSSPLQGSEKKNEKRGQVFFNNRRDDQPGTRLGEEGEDKKKKNMSERRDRRAVR